MSFNIIEWQSWIMTEDYKERKDLNSKEVLNSRMIFLKLEENYRSFLREIETEVDDTRIKYGIRHLSGNIEKPFVSLGSEYPLSKEILNAHLIEKIKNDFSFWKPKWLSFLTTPDLNYENSFTGRLYVVGSLEELKKTNSDITLKNVEEKDLVKIMNWYEDEYNHFHEENPNLRDWVSINSKEEMQDCIRQNLLFEAFKDDESIGLIGAINSEFNKAPGIYMMEILLRRKFRGRGLGYYLESEFIKKLPKDILLWGTIDSRNHGSLKSALKIGRKEIMKEVFIKL